MMLLRMALIINQWLCDIIVFSENIIKEKVLLSLGMKVY